MLLALVQKVSISNHQLTQKSYYLFVVARAIREQATLDWANVIVLERLQITQVVWPHKVHHAPVLFQSVLEGVSCQNHSRGSLDLADRNRNFCLERKKKPRLSCVRLLDCQYFPSHRIREQTYLSILDGVTFIGNGDGGTRFQKQVAHSIQLALQVGRRRMRIAQIAEQIITKEQHATVGVPLFKNCKAADGGPVVVC